MVLVKSISQDAGRDKTRLVSMLVALAAVCPSTARCMNLHGFECSSRFHVTAWVTKRLNQCIFTISGLTSVHPFGPGAASKAKNHSSKINSSLKNGAHFASRMYSRLYQVGTTRGSFVLRRLSLMPRTEHARLRQVLENSLAK